MKKYKITLNNKVFEVDIEEVTETTGEEDATITKIGSLDKQGNTEQYFGSNENGI